MAGDDVGRVDSWLEILWDHRGSDLLLAGGSAPRIRVNGRLIPVEGAPSLSAKDVADMAFPLLTEGQRGIFDSQMDVDFAFSWRDLARVRGSVFTQRGQAAMSLRIIPSRIPSFEELGLPCPRTGKHVAPRTGERVGRHQPTSPG